MKNNLYEKLMDEALEQAQLSYDEGGLPIGAVLAKRNGEIVSRGHNRRVQDGDPTSHGETDCIRKAGRRRDWRELILVTTLSPCIMCSGTALLFQIPTIVIGENENYLGAEDLLRERGIELIHLDHAGCKELMARFQREKPDVWNEDIGR
ncbi:MAG: nucleoside deaminase [Planctomycetota bacterium]